MTFSNHQARSLFGEVMHELLYKLEMRLPAYSRQDVCRLTQKRTGRPLHPATNGARAQKDMAWCFQELLQETQDAQMLIPEPELPLLKKTLDENYTHALSEHKITGLTPDLLIQTGKNCWRITDLKVQILPPYQEKLHKKSAFYAIAAMLFFINEGFADPLNQKIECVRWLYLNKDERTTTHLDVPITSEFLASIAGEMNLTPRELIPKLQRKKLHERQQKTA